MKEISPPKWAIRFLQMICPEELFEEIEGDLIQKFTRDVKTFAERKARRRFVWNTIRFFRPGIILRNKFSFELNSFYMLSHFFKIFFRTSLKNGTYSFINVTGLATGIACSIFVLLWVNDELTFDHFHQNKESIYAIRTNHSYADGNVVTGWSSTGQLAGALRKLPEIEEACRVTFRGRVLFQFKKESVYEEGVYADASIFQIFTIPFLEGNPNHALSDNNSVVISQKLAQKYFKNESAIGNVLRLDNKDVKVTGIFANLPENSTLRFDFILPYSIYALTDEYNQEWGAWTGGITYVKLYASAGVESLNQKIPTAITQPNIWPRWGDNVELFLFPMTQWRLYNNFKFGKQDGGRISFVKAFGIVGIFILVIACINFMNLSTARAVSRAREVGVRKVAGAGRLSLIHQFMSESVFISFAALCLALLIVHLLLPFVNGLTDKSMRMDYSSSFLPGSLFIITLITGIIAGSYPAFFLSSFRPVHVLKGRLLGLSGEGVRKGLVVFQFCLSVILIICALVVHQQVEFMRSKDLGFDKENTFYFNTSENFRKNFESFRHEALQNPAIRFVSQASANPMEINNGLELGDNGWPGKTEEDNVIFQWLHCDYDFLTSLGFTLVEGRNFSRDVIADSTNFIISEEAARQMKLENPVGQMLKVDRMGQIIGVIKDFHSSGFQNPIQPVIITLRPERTDRMFIRFEAGHEQDAMLYVHKLMKKFEPGFPIEFAFMDEPFGRQYQTEILIGKLSTCFTIIAIFISCIGLFGLASFTAEKRTKEIGIRKVMGATAGQVILMLCKEFVFLVMLALIIGIPLAAFGMQKFLTLYKFHTEIGVAVFGFTILAMLSIALITVSIQSARAAYANPVNSLRSE